MILDKFPDAQEFYKKYWGRRPFVVRGVVDAELLKNCIDPESLAGLSLEEDIKSRIVITDPAGGKWTCEHGPFEEDKFSTLGDTHWSLLVQNVEQYYTDTADLLSYFDFAPRWFMDDIMVSYSTAGGSVGPHIDSYHVFLVQGIGCRTWRVSDAPIANPEFIQGQDLKVLKHSFAGMDIEVGIGDVIYIPPQFAHEGTTIESALTFSVGFLGPKMSDILGEYGHHLDTIEALNKRYNGAQLDEESAGALIAPQAHEHVQECLIDIVQSEGFKIWMSEYFSKPSHDDVENLDMREDPLDWDAILLVLDNKNALYKPSHIKYVITLMDNETMCLAVFGESMIIESAHVEIIKKLANGDMIFADDLKDMHRDKAIIEILLQLYNHNFLSIGV